MIYWGRFLLPYLRRKAENLELEPSATGGFMYWYMEVMRKYFVFSGRARRKEYWTFQLINLVIVVALLVAIIPPLISNSQNFFPMFLAVFLCIFALAMVIPGLAVAVRRLHDIGFSGWWFLIAFVPLGSLVLLVLHLLDSTPGANRYGPNPKTGNQAGFVSPYPPYGAPPIAPYEAQSMTRAAGAGAALPGGQSSLGFCNVCGTSMPAGTRFCSNCGKAAY